MRLERDFRVSLAVVAAHLALFAAGWGLAVWLDRGWTGWALAAVLVLAGGVVLDRVLRRALSPEGWRREMADRVRRGLD